MLDTQQLPVYDMLVHGIINACFCFHKIELIITHFQVATIAWFEADSVCGSHAVAIPIVLVLPYIFRLFQCLRQYKDTGEKSTLLNGKISFQIYFPKFLRLFFYFDPYFNVKLDLPRCFYNH